MSVMGWSQQHRKAGQTVLPATWRQAPLLLGKSVRWLTSIVVLTKHPILYG